MSKRTQSETPTEDGATKRPRLDIQEQFKRAGILAEQLRNTVGKDEVDSKTTVANQIASEELVRIFESMQEQTADTSESVDQLIRAQIELEVNKTMAYLDQKTTKHHPLGKEVAQHLNTASLRGRQVIVEVVQPELPMDGYPYPVYWILSNGYLWIGSTVSIQRLSMDGSTGVDPLDISTNPLD
ncbi:hypothetical protein D6C84_03423 [Aureobasidium pullulans]|uniref:Uncharacterized protein n=1 Tax=Aureobasidium pullulans TaxID=5580 RepID=A0A4S9Y2U9_AURPU|nr:hypothetical protein D6C84_03423 [Aureobasidium pullulans]